MVDVFTLIYILLLLYFVVFNTVYQCKQKRIIRMYNNNKISLHNMRQQSNKIKEQARKFKIVYITIMTPCILANVFWIVNKVY